MSNRLSDATSPYLLQHASNPVDWYQWGPEAIERATAQDKPILLSIGYSACHWCHVMERESFEDEHTASIMNRYFVSIKVDREERPDLDAIYMDAVQTMTGQGGWPMTVFCTPDGHPFYGGTYYPPEDRHGLPSFGRVLLAVATAWRDQRQDLIAQSHKLTESLARGLPAQGSHEQGDAILRAAFDRMSDAFDNRWGGFGRAPKFPQPMNLEFLLRCVRRGFDGADSMLAGTLARMACGGIFDQAGGGFHRYSVDAVWQVPHFEKMLYDNAQLLRLYARAAVVAEGSGSSSALGPGLPLWHRTAIATGEYLLREMRHPSGGLFSSQDADSEGVEGKFYVWNRDELLRVAGDDGPASAAMLGVTQEGNWEGSNILWMQHPPTEIAASLGIGVEQLDAATRRALAALAAHRRTRVPPATDDKVLAAWNGLAISALAEAGRLLRRPDFVDAARSACDFVLEHLRDGSGRLQRSWREGRSSGPAFLDDHALMAAACLDLYETTFDERYFLESVKLADTMLALFSDDGGSGGGGLFDTGSDQTGTLIVRPKDLFDNAVPAGSSAGASILARIGAITGEARYTHSAESVVEAAKGVLKSSPLGFGVWLQALDDLTTGFKEIAIAGRAESRKAQVMAQVAWARPMLPRVIAAGSPDSSVPLLAKRDARGKDAIAYVCENFVCSRPVEDPSALAGLLDGS